MEIVNITHQEVRSKCQSMVEMIKEFGFIGVVKIYPIPRGGVPVAYHMNGAYDRIAFEVVDKPGDADIFVDDIIDSGSTCEKYRDEFPGVGFFALIDKRGTDYSGKWVVMPWEKSAETGVVDHITRLIEFIGDDPTRQGLVETPRRVAEAYKFWFSGYNRDPKSVLKVFTDGAETYDQMVTVQDIPFYSHCEHHIAPFFGRVTISYIPNGAILGLSKFSRLVDIFARRLQTQERLTEQIADALYNNIPNFGVGVRITARHLCKESRGICQQGSTTLSTALRGAIRTEAETRAEFLNLVKQ